MIVKLHKNARTTPAIRAQLAASNEPVAVLAKRFNLAPNTVRKWQSRTDFNDRSHTAHNLQTTLNSAQEQIVIYLRKQLLLPLDDLLSVTREFLCPEVSRSGLNRCLRRHNVGNLREMTRTQDNKPKYQRFKDYSIGYVHIDVKYLPQMPDETKRRYLFVAIDRATRMVCVQLRHSKTANDAKAFLKSVTERFPFKVSKVLTDNGKEFTNKVFGQKAADNTHEFDLLCQSLGIEHRLTKVRRPQTNGMVERFNGRIADILRTHHFQSGKELEHTLKRYIDLYNNHLPQANLNCRTPCQVMFEWYEKKPQSFNKPVHNRTEGDMLKVPLAHVGHTDAEAAIAVIIKSDWQGDANSHFEIKGVEHKFSLPRCGAAPHGLIVPDEGIGVCQTMDGTKIVINVAFIIEVIAVIFWMISFVPD